MQKIELAHILKEKDIYIFRKHPFINNFLISLLERILLIKRVNNFIEKNSHLDTVTFIKELFDSINFSYLISSNEIERIPAEGRLICVSNHPIGSLDGLSLLKAFLEVRNDVKIIANDVLIALDIIKPYILPVNIFSLSTSKREYITTIKTALENECAVIIFPAASVSRLNWFRIMDSAWHKGAISLARKYSCPILPVYIEGKNSTLFYLVSLISKNISTLLLSYEMFNKKDRSIRIKIGELIPNKAFSNSYINDTYNIKLLKKHVYLFGKKNKTVFKTEKNVVHPVDRRFIKRELNNSRLLCSLNDKMQIYLTNKNDSPHCINEIARLRETTFRKIGEGTGRKLDIDKFDCHYSHIILWDDVELEIVGSYRIGNGKLILNNIGLGGLYTASLFNFSPEFETDYIPQSFELGRSFIQKKYWNTKALDYLWRGIGTYISLNPEIKFLFGAVSISNSYPEPAKKMIVHFYQKWYSSKVQLVESQNKYIAKLDHEFSKLFNGNSSRKDYLILKNILKSMNSSVPVLYKHYTDLCDDGGVRFLDFGVDPDFKNCIDGLILVDIEKIKNEKKKKYINPQLNEIKISA